MIAATRHTARELEDGTLEVVVHVHSSCKAEFFEVAPKPGDWVTLTAKEKPPTQGATPTSAEAPAMMAAAADSDTIGRARKLSANPQFQLYVEEVSPNTAPGADAERRAQTFVNATLAGIGGLPNKKKLDSIEESFAAWREKRGMQ